MLRPSELLDWLLLPPPSFFLFLSHLLADLFYLSSQVAGLPFPAIFQHTSLAPGYIIFLENAAI